MLKAFGLAGLGIFLTMVAGGCGGAQPGKAIITYERDSEVVPKLSTVEERGLYALFSGAGVAPLEAVYLYKGDQFGFINRDGLVVGAYIKAGKTTTIAIDGVVSSDYTWKWQGDKQP